LHRSSAADTSTDARARWCPRAPNAISQSAMLFYFYDRLQMDLDRQRLGQMLRTEIGWGTDSNGRSCSRSALPRVMSCLTYNTLRTCSAWKLGKKISRENNLQLLMLLLLICTMHPINTGMNLFMGNFLSFKKALCWVKGNSRRKSEYAGGEDVGSHCFFSL
jgi:hypothetical protein